MWIVINGDPVDGHVFTGPFESAEAATQWAEMANLSTSWWVTLLDSPNVDDEETTERQRLYKKYGDERLRG